MSDQDYKAGEQGLRYDRSMDRTAYDAGKAAREDRDAIAAKNPQPQFGPSGSGAGAGLLLLIPLFPFIYPVAGAVALGSFYVLYRLTNANNFNGLLVFLLVFVLPIAVFLFARRWETKVAVRFRLYRFFRAIIRFAAVTVLSALLFAAGDRRGPSPGQNFAGFLIAVFSQIFIFPRLNRWEREDAET